MKNTVKVTTPSDREVTMTRVFHAPCAMVYDAWTRPELIKKWLYGPSEDWSLAVCDMELRPGGAIRWVWRKRDGFEMGLRGEYREVVPNAKLVHTELFDEDWTGGETLVTITFDERAGKTTVTMTVLYPSREARDAALKNGVDGMAVGYDRLEKILAASVVPQSSST
jgi:uncharacterized protein YndB with AHSA1/START domain